VREREREIHTDIDTYGQSCLNVCVCGVRAFVYVCERLIERAREEEYMIVCVCVCLCVCVCVCVGVKEREPSCRCNAVP